MAVHQVGARFPTERLGNVKGVEIPDSLQSFIRASQGERDRRVRRVLAQAWAHYRAGEVSLIDSINAASGGGVEGEYAKRFMRAVLLRLDLDDWEKHPSRVRADVHRLFRVTIGRLTPHRGGWLVAIAGGKAAAK